MQKTALLRPHFETGLIATLRPLQHPSSFRSNTARFVCWTNPTSSKHPPLGPRTPSDSTPKFLSGEVPARCHRCGSITYVSDIRNPRERYPIQPNPKTSNALPTRCLSQILTHTPSVLLIRLMRSSLHCGGGQKLASASKNTIGNRMMSVITDSS